MGISTFKPPKWQRIEGAPKHHHTKIKKTRLLLCSNSQDAVWKISALSHARLGSARHLHNWHPFWSPCQTRNLPVWKFSGIWELFSWSDVSITSWQLMKFSIFWIPSPRSSYISFVGWKLHFKWANPHHSFLVYEGALSTPNTSAFLLRDFTSDILLGSETSEGQVQSTSPSGRIS